MTELSLQTYTCPMCQAILVSIDPAKWSRCVACGARFVAGTPRPVAVMSKKAVFCLILGLGSMCLSVIGTIPALILGALALRDIRRSPGRFVGRSMAVAGLICASLFGLIHVVGTIGVVVIAKRTMDAQTNDPEEVARRSRSFADFTLPEGVEPFSATNFIGIQMVGYRSRTKTGRPTTQIEFQVMPKLFSMPDSQANRQAHNRIRHRQTFEAAQRSVQEIGDWRVGDGRNSVLRVVEESPGGIRFYAAYATAIKLHDQQILISLRTWPNRSDKEGGVVMSEEQVRQFFESLK